MEDSIPDRYESNPMLVLVENYILDAIGRLEPEKAARLAEIVQRTFGGGDWRVTIQEQFALPADSPVTLQQLWKARQEEAETKQEDCTAEDFAREQADKLFEGLGQ